MATILYLKMVRILLWFTLRVLNFLTFLTLANEP